MKSKISIVLLLVLISMLAFQTVSAAQLLFQPYINFPVGDGQAVGIGDFNSDGLNDVAMTTSTQLLIFLQNDSGGLAGPAIYSAGTGLRSLAVGDLNNDGRDDIVFANSNSNTISVFLQLSNGTLASRVTFPTSNTPDAVAVGDVNYDGLDDIAVSHWNAGNIGILTQTSAGTLNAMVTYVSPQAGYDDIDIADINNDGRNDVIKMNGQGYANPQLSVYLQNVNGTLDNPAPYSLGCNCLGHGIGTGDVTGDGLMDVVLSYGGNRPSSMVAVFAQAQDGSLQPAVSYAAYDIPEPVEVADVNSDGLADVLTLHGGWNRVGVFLQQNGTLSPYSLHPIPYASHYQPQGFEIGDVNNDALPDLVIADYNNGLVVLHHTSPFVDDTPPVITATAVKGDGTPYDADIWTNQTVTVKFTCSDTDSGIATCPEDQVFSDEGVTQLTTGTATDNAGNSASASFGPIKIDKTAPALFIAVSPNPVVLNGNAELLKNAADNLSGVRSGPCLNIDTSTVGFKSVTCIVEDYAGNRTTTTAGYRVIYDFDGFLNPVIDCVNNTCENYNISIFNAGSTIPLKIQLKDANGNVVRAPNAPLWLVPTKFDNLPFPLPTGYIFQVSNTPYEWKKNQAIYVYDWSTKGLPKQSIWLVGVRLDDGMTYYVFVALK